jgi:peptidoglycan/xylan/chitin deacetylase (PgdA/CDA1 family)
MSAWQWPAGTRCGVFFSVNFDAESLDLHATSEKRLFGRFSYGRYGARAGFPRLLTLLERHGIAATFFVPAADAERHARLVRALLERGHEIAARGVSLEDLPKLGAAEADTLARSRDALARLTGSAPAGFRAPGNRLSVHTLGHLARLGFAYDASFQDDDYPYRFDLGGGRTLVEIPSCFALDDAPAYSGRHSHRRLMQTWRDEFDAMYEAGVLCPLTVHLRGDIGSTRAARIAALDEFLDYLKSRPGVRFMQGRALAAHAEALGLPGEPDPAAAHLDTLRVTPYRGDLSGKPM